MAAFRNILVDIDAAAPQHPAFAAACDLAVRFDAAVTLVDVMPDITRPDDNVVTRHVHEQLAQRRRAGLAALAEGRADMRVSTTVLEGKPAVAIIQQVLEANHDLVVRSHARDLVPGRLYGAVDMQLLRKCPCPVWLLAPQPRVTPPHIVAAVDVGPEGSNELNRTILDVALTMGNARQAEVTVLHVWSLYGEELLRHAMREQALVDALESARQTATERLASLLSAFGSRAAEVRIECVKGEPLDVIPRFGAARGVDMVVMGTVARTGIAGFLMGNTAEAVLRQLRGSVLAVKPPGFVTPVTPGTRAVVVD